jgi:hypothetical protein
MVVVLLSKRKMLPKLKSRPKSGGLMLLTHFMEIKMLSSDMYVKSLKKKYTTRRSTNDVLILSKFSCITFRYI